MMIRPPSLFNRALEGRFVAEAGALVAMLPILRLQAPRGRGPVMVLPGFLADDTSTILLRRFVGSLGYRTRGWGLGASRGRMLDLLPRVTDRVKAFAGESGEPVQLLGWSRGGVLAREVARDRPELVARVVTLGSPVQGGAGATSIGALIRRETGMTPAQMVQLMRQRDSRPIETPIVAIYSKTDGVVAWQACVDDVNPNVRHFEVAASHVGMGCNPEVFRRVAQALAGKH